MKAKVMRQRFFQELEDALQFMRHNQRPLVTLTYAQSLDGSLASRDRGKLQLSGPESLDLTHLLRARHDAILLGSETTLREDPRLTVRRGVRGDHPIPVILDSSLRIRPDARLFAETSRTPILVLGEDIARDKVSAYPAGRARFLFCRRNPDGTLDIVDLLNKLSAAGISSIMVEGGIRVITAFTALRIPDWLVLTVAPGLAGGLPALEGLGPRDPGCIRLREWAWEPAGEDMIVWARPQWSSGHHRDRKSSRRSQD